MKSPRSFPCALSAFAPRWKLSNICWSSFSSSVQPVFVTVMSSQPSILPKPSDICRPSPYLMAFSTRFCSHSARRSGSQKSRQSSKCPTVNSVPLSLPPILCFVRCCLKCLALILYEQREQVELLRRELHVLAVDDGSAVG